MEQPEQGPEQKSEMTEAQKVLAMRDRTGLPLLKCRNALRSSGGDIELAIKLLREEFMRDRRYGVLYSPEAR